MLHLKGTCSTSLRLKWYRSRKSIWMAVTPYCGIHLPLLSIPYNRASPPHLKRHGENDDYASRQGLIICSTVVSMFRLVLCGQVETESYLISPLQGPDATHAQLHALLRYQSQSLRRESLSVVNIIEKCCQICENVAMWLSDLEKWDLDCRRSYHRLEDHPVSTRSEDRLLPVLCSRFRFEFAALHPILLVDHVSPLDNGNGSRPFGIHPPPLGDKRIPAKLRSIPISSCTRKSPAKPDVKGPSADRTSRKTLCVLPSTELIKDIRWCGGVLTPLPDISSIQRSLGIRAYSEGRSTQNAQSSIHSFRQPSRPRADPRQRVSLSVSAHRFI